jgi:hypothetical protein
MKYLTESIKILVILALVVVGVGIVQAWTGPTATPPNGNTSAPINVSDITQEKAGIFGSNGFYSLGTGWFSTSTRVSWPPTNLTLGINGAVGAKQYCDDNGANCKTMTELGGGSTGGVPTGAVMAFNLTSCPSGWTAYSAAAGRNIVGYGSGTGLTARTTLGQTGGEEKHVQTVAEMAAHSHSVSVNGINGVNSTDGSAGRNETNAEVGSSVLYGGTSITGGGTAMPVMDPFVVLLYCQKS